MASSTLKVENAQICREHTELYESFCRIHDCLCCQQCVFVRHKHCTDIIPLNDIVCNVQESAAFQDMDRTLNELMENIQIIKRKGENQLCSIKEMKETVEKSIFSLRKQMNDHLSKLQDEILLDLYKIEDGLKKEIKESMKLLNNAQKEITEYQLKFMDMKNCTDDRKTFLEMKRIEPGVTQNQTFLEGLANDKLKSVYISLNTDHVMKNFITNVPSIGEIETKAMHDEIKLVRKKSKQAQIRVVRIISQSIESVTLKLQREVTTGARNIKGCTAVGGDGFAFVNFDPSSLILVRNSDDVETVRLDTIRSADVTFVDQSTVAISSGSERSITLFDFIEKASKKTIETINPCDGVICKDNYLLFCARNIGLEKISLNNSTNPSRLVTSRLGLFSYLATSGNKIYFTNSAENTVTCCDLQGNTIWKFKNEPELKSPAGICVDNQCHIFVAGMRTNNVVVISADGNRIKELLSREDNIHHPQALAFCPDSKQLVVCHAEGKALYYSVGSAQ